VRKSPDEGRLKDIMKILRQTLFIAILTICASFAAFAQSRDDKQKTPPKDGERPLVRVKEKDPPPPREGRPPRNDNRNNDNKNKKPEATNLNLLRFWQE
jgi:hypothetical protein